MPDKKDLIIFVLLCLIALGLGYWYGLPDKPSEERAEAGTPSEERAEAGTPPEERAEAGTPPEEKADRPGPVQVRPGLNIPMPGGTTNAAHTNAVPARPPAPEKLIADPIVEKAIRSEFGPHKPTGELTKADLANVTRLHLYNTKVTDAGLKDIAKMQQLTGLDLSGTQVTDAGLKDIAKLKKLERLHLIDTKITDAGLKELAKLQGLTDLYLRGTQITDAGAAELGKALPKCEILW